jgi:hypothetical protein
MLSRVTNLTAGYLPVPGKFRKSAGYIGPVMFGISNPPGIMPPKRAPRPPNPPFPPPAFWEAAGLASRRAVAVITGANIFKIRFSDSRIAASCLEWAEDLYVYLYMA